MYLLNIFCRKRIDLSFQLMLPNLRFILDYHKYDRLSNKFVFIFLFEIFRIIHKYAIEHKRTNSNFSIDIQMYLPYNVNVDFHHVSFSGKILYCPQKTGLFIDWLIKLAGHPWI